MTVTNQNIIIYRGNDAELDIPITDVNGDGYDLSGACNLYYVIEFEPGSGSVLRKTSGSGITVSGSVATIVLTDTDTYALMPGNYCHSLLIVDSSNLVSTAMTGNLDLLSGYYPGD